MVEGEEHPAVAAFVWPAVFVARGGETLPWHLRLFEEELACLLNQGMLARHPYIGQSLHPEHRAVELGMPEVFLVDPPAF